MEKLMHNLKALKLVCDSKWRGLSDASIKHANDIKEHEIYFERYLPFTMCNLIHELVMPSLVMHEQQKGFILKLQERFVEMEQ